MIGDGCQIMIDSNAKLRSIQMPFCNYGLRNIYLRKNATLYEVYHEVIHAKQFAKIGREAYEALGRLSREEHVLNEILKSKNLFNEAEIAHAIKYVEGLREKFMMGLTN
ncbi:zincin-like metallopeptidase toxin domain-containing protein [Escherichia coli]|uniref:zincin-like metallopeptidase toxin domain-containing protein n=1 Tax=Escherichia coli TaxID=562 RepID=UPI003890E733